jgi:hypothetical protein
MKTLRHGGQAHGATVAAGLGHHVRVPALDTDTDPVNRSHQQSTATLSLMSHRRREGQSAKRMVGEKRLVKGTFPHITPVVSRRPLTRPRQPPPRRTLRPARPGPIRSSPCPRERRHHPHQQPATPPDAFPVGQRLVHRSAAALPQATVGSGSNHPDLPPPNPRPHSPPCSTHCPTPAPTPMSRTFSPVISRGNAKQPHLPHTQCICGCMVGPRTLCQRRVNSDPLAPGVSIHAASTGRARRGDHRPSCMRGRRWRRWSRPGWAWRRRLTRPGQATDSRPCTLFDCSCR